MIKYLGRSKRIKLGFYLPALGRAYRLQVKRKILFFNVWVSVGWTYPEIHSDYADMKRFLLWKEQFKIDEKLKNNFYGYNPLKTTNDKIYGRNRKKKLGP